MDKLTKLSIGVLMIFLWFFSCKQEPEINPFENIVATQDTVRLQLSETDSASFAGLYINVFRPTCANVGCHDGSFEPDYRTLESSYNTMVFQTPIKNNGHYDFRVSPGDPQRSVLLARLGGEITPLMPFQIEPDSDWGQNQRRYYDQIRDWIAAGAPDVMGNVPVLSSPAPRLIGAIGLHEGNLLSRSGANGPLQVSQSMEEIEIWLAFSHEEMSPSQFTNNKIKFFDDPHFFEDPIELDLEILPNGPQERGFHGSIVSYTHRVKIQPSALLGQTSQVFFRAYVKDEKNPITEIPSDNGVFYVKTYMSYRLQ